MRRIIAAVATIALFSGCSLTGLLSGDGTSVERVIADLGCISALANAAVVVSGDPAVGGAKTVMDVVAAIGKVGASNVPATALSACAETLKYAEKDFAGTLAYLKATKGSSAAVVPAPRAYREGFAPAYPTVVRVPIPPKG